MVSVLDSGTSGPGSSPGLGHCDSVFLGKTLYSHSASLHPRVLIYKSILATKFWVTCDGQASHSRGVAIPVLLVEPSRLHATETGKSSGSVSKFGSSAALPYL